MTDICISATIVTHNNSGIIMNACNSILNNTKKYPVELTVFDNASTDNTVDILKEHTGFNVVENKKNLGFGKANNLCMEREMGQYHFAINPDISFDTDVLSEIVDFMEENPDVVMCMPKVLNTDGTIQYLPKRVPNFKYLFFSRVSAKLRKEYTRSDEDISSPCEIDFCSGCFFCIRSNVYKKLGGFDERYFMYLEDADLTVRAKKYGKIMFLPQCSVTHIWGRESRKKIKFLFIHLSSCAKFLLRGSKTK